MKNWLNKNYKILIILAFLIPIVIVAIVSISHVTIWYGISNPMSWAMYLSLGVEIAALSALAAISASMGRNVYFPFIIVTIIQFIGNIFFSYQYIDINSKIFKDWVDLVSPLISSLGVEQGDMIGHRRFLALFSGGLLPLISLSFLHMLVKFSEDARLNKHNIINDDIKTQVDDKIIEDEIKKRFESGEVPNIVTASDIIGEVSKVRLSDEDIKKLEEILMNPPKPNKELKKSVEDYSNEYIKTQNTVSEDVKPEEDNFDYTNADIFDISVTNEKEQESNNEDYDSSSEEGYTEDEFIEEIKQIESTDDNITDEEYKEFVEEKDDKIVEETFEENNTVDNIQEQDEQKKEEIITVESEIEQIENQTQIVEPPLVDNQTVSYDVINNPISGFEKKN